MGTDNICATWIQVQFCSLVAIKGWFVLVGAEGCSPYLTQRNQCCCSLAEPDIFHMSKGNKICHCARQRKLFLKHKVPLQWFVFISSLDEHCN